MKSFDLYDLLNNTSSTIIQLRTAKNMSQQNLADKIDISYSYMSEIENDKVDMGLRVFKRIASVLDLTNRPE